MSHPEIVPSSLYPAIYQFLSENKLTKTLKAFKKESGTTNENSEWNLMDLFKSYVATHKSNGAASKEKDVNMQQENGHDKQKDKKDKKKEKKEKKKENKRKKEEVEETPAIISPPVKEPKAKKQKIEEPVVEKEKEPQEDKKKKKKENKRKREEETIEEEAPKENGSTPSQDQNTETAPQESNPVNSPKGSHNKKAKNEPFRRVKEEEAEFIDPRLKNNDFTTKNGDDWGKKAWNELKVVKGRDFRHQKTKRKKGYRPGGQLDLGVNSVKFQYSDEE